jgi:hypothetical protein
MSRLSASMRMSTQSELVSGVTILSASLLMRAVSAVSPIGLARDLLGFMSVLFLLAGAGVVVVGLAHLVTRASDDGPPADQSGQMSTEATLATGAVIGVGIGCSIGAMYGGALPVALGTSIGAALGVALASQWVSRQRQQ